MFKDDAEIMLRVERLARNLNAQHRRLATAESCTGGLLSGACTAIAGSSKWFQGGVVAYHNHLKTALLGVAEDLLEQHGAVSRETVESMALGACKLMKAPLGVAISGIAGPGGGSREKPVGTVCIGVALDGVACSETFHLAGDRSEVRRQSLLMALDMLLMRVEDDTCLKVDSSPEED